MLPCCYDYCITDFADGIENILKMQRAIMNCEWEALSQVSWRIKSEFKVIFKWRIELKHLT